MRFDNIQYIRAVGAVAVVAAHVPLYAHFRLGVGRRHDWPDPLVFVGGLAVVTFFAVSGFVLTHALRSGSLRSFLAFRLLRLYPAYWVAFGLVLAAHLTFGTLLPFGWKGLPYAMKWPEFWYAVFLLPVGKTGVMYVLGVEWTLVYELCLSLALGALALTGRRWGLGIGATVWLGLCLWNQALRPQEYNDPMLPTLAQWPLSAVNTPFLFGVLACLTHRRWGAFRQWAPVVAVLALSASALFPIPRGAWAMPLQGLAAGLVLGYAAGGRQVAADHPVAAAGEWAYGVYLLHVPVLCIFYTLTVRHGWLPPTPATVIFGGVLAFAAGAVYGAAESAAYRWVRARLVRLTRRGAAAAAPQPAPAGAPAGRRAA